MLNCVLRAIHQFRGILQFLRLFKDYKNEKSPEEICILHLEEGGRERSKRRREGEEKEKREKEKDEEEKREKEKNTGGSGEENKEYKQLGMHMT